jgi:hypothetical protein
MKQTAVEWLLDNLKEIYLDIDTYNLIIDESKSIEKKQIEDAFDKGDMVGRSAIIRELDPNDKVVLKYPEMSAKQYYKETFKSEEL